MARQHDLEKSPQAASAGWRKALPWVRRLGLWVLVPMFVLGLAADLLLVRVVPGVIQSRLQQIGSAALGRAVRIDSVRVEPAQLAVEIDGFHVLDADGRGDFASFERFRVTLSSASLRHRAPVIAAMQLDGLSVHLERDALGQLSTDDMALALNRWRASRPPSAPSADLPRFALYNLSLRGAHVILDDKLSHVRHEAQQIELDVPLFSTLEAREQIRVDPRFSAMIDGSEVAWHGQSYPFAAVPGAKLELELTDLDLNRLAAWVPGMAAVDPAGRASLHLTVETQMPAQGEASVTAQGNLTVHGLRVVPVAAGTPVRLDDVSLQLRQFHFPAGQQEAALDIRGKQIMTAAGSADWSTLGMDLSVEVQALDLSPWAAAFKGGLALDLTRGQLVAKARIQHQPSAGDWQLAGDLALEKVATIDHESAKDLVSFDRLAVHGLQVNTQPVSLRADQIDLDGCSARVVLDASGQLNVVQALRGGPQGAAPRQAAATPAGVAPAPRAARQAPIAMRIGRIQVRDAKVQYTDAFVQPAYRADITDMHGSVLGLDGGAGSTAQLQWQGKVNAAPLLIDGSFDATAPASRLHIHASVRGMEMTDLSPYAGKYAGYRIERGKLSFDADYRIEQRQLVAQNRLIVDQLTFGDRVDSPDAVSLPVSLAVALLKDRDGVIDIDLPVGGSIDDPQFSVGALVWRSLLNLVTKAVAAPFAWLGNLVQGTGELSQVGFAPGDSTLTDEARQRMASLVSVLTQRPQIKLDISGAVDAQADTPPLKREKLEKWLRSIKRKDMAQAGRPTASADIVIDEAERVGLMRRALAQSSGPDDNHPESKAGTPAQAPAAQPLPAEVSAADLRAQLEARIDVGQDDLVALGNRRARLIKQWLIEQGKVDDARLAVIVARVRDPADAAAPFTGVRLEIHD